VKYQERFDDIMELVQGANSAEDAQARVVEHLYERFRRYDWVGIYRLEGEELVLGPWKGKAATEHVRIRVGEGVCGACAVSCRTELVPDVGADARYLACFSETRSEIVVPIVKKGRFWGEIDIDSGTLNAFDPDDVEFLEAMAKLLAERI
jgi:L-methionine (R)-S-oxide reductase